MEPNEEDYSVWIKDLLGAFAQTIALIAVTGVLGFYAGWLVGRVV